MEAILIVDFSPSHYKDLYYYLGLASRGPIFRKVIRLSIILGDENRRTPREGPAQPQHLVRQEARLS